jgi:SagB-type dehydrogenase family enzyme
LPEVDGTFGPSIGDRSTRILGIGGFEMFRAIWAVGALVSFGAVACSGGEGQIEPSPGAVPTGTVIELPAPRTEGDLSLEQALLERRSVRGFTAEELTLQELSQLLWAAQGVTASWGGRTAPSAGALYPLEVYAATPEGLYHYLPKGHRAEIVSTSDLRAALSAAAGGQEAVADAPAVFAITAVPARTEAKYGERAERYVQLEAGHVAQNVLLEAVALGLGGVPIGAFSDDEVARVLRLPSGEGPLYLVAVGHSAEVG